MREARGGSREDGRMGSYVLGFQQIDQTQVAIVGGKGAHLGELWRIQGIRVPAGFCVTTDAFRRIMEDAPSIDDRLDRLSQLNPDDREAIRALSAEIRRTLEGIVIPDDLAAAITPPLARLREPAAHALRTNADAGGRPAGVLPGRRNHGGADRAGAAGAAGVDGCAGRAARAARPEDRGALRPPPGHRMVPGRR